MIYTTPPPIIQEYICCGGYTDENGITWQRTGRYLATQKDYMSVNEQVCRFYPTVNPKSMVHIKHMSKHPDIKDITEDSMKLYEYLLSVSKKKHVIRNGETFLTREYVENSEGIEMESK